MRTGILFFFLVPVLGNIYVMWRVWQILPLPILYKVFIMLLIVCAFASIFINFMPVKEQIPIPAATVLYETGNSWLIILLYLFMIFLILDLGRLMHIVPSSFMKHSTVGSVSILTIMLVTFIYGNIHYHHKIRRELNITTEKQIEKPVKIVMMSDLHIGYHNRRAEFAKWVDKINAEHPHLILIAGDIIDNSVRPLLAENVAEEFRRLEAPVLACLGNHEYFSGESAAQQFFKDAGIALLRDSVVQWDGQITIIGRDDRSNLRRKSIAQLMDGTDQSNYTILLDHQPYHLEEAEQNGIDFQFSGHTHHGQVWPLSWITDASYEDSYGPYQRGKTHYYVSSGIGIWGGKFRIGTCSEYVVFTLSSTTENH